ncbi:MAG: chromate transporter, partial [Oscillospiraceae bacterium]|nr:chromate transporter [Oscillospiraceae bacterium]
PMSAARRPASGALIATAAVVLTSFAVILLITALLKKLLKNPYVQAILRGLKPCMIGIVLATGVYMVLHNCLGNVAAFSPDTTAVVMTAALAAVYFGSRKILRNGISPIALIGISAVAGILVYGA